MITFSESLEIGAPAEEVWAIIRDFEHVNRWVTDLETSVPEGEGVGMLRHLVQKDGKRVLERLDALDESTKTIEYHIVQSDLPFSTYHSKIQVKSKDPDSCEVLWTSALEPKGIDSEQILKTLKTNYLRYLERLRTLTLAKG
jgi:mxaD protein